MKSSNLKQGLKKIPVLGDLLKFINRKLFIKKYAPYDAPSEWLNKLLKEDEAQIVQIGSNDGVQGDPIHGLLKTNAKWSALFVEPIPYLFEKLKKNYGNDSRFSFENVAINDGTTQTFFSVKEEAKKDLPDLPEWYDQLGSFNRENIVKHLDGVLEPYITETELTGMSLKELFHKNNIDDLTLLHIDTEGYDWKILSQLDLDDVKPKVILIEHKHLTRTERKSLVDFLKSDYLIFKLGGDLIAILKDYENQYDVKNLKGELIT